MICNYNQFLDFVLMLSEQEIPKPAYNYRYTQVLSTLEGTVKIDIFERLTSHQYSTIIFLLL